MNKRRSRSTPAIPKSAVSFAEFMLTTAIGLTVGGEFFTKDTVDCGQDGYAVILTSDALLGIMKAGKEYIIDGTFKVVPSIFYQLVTLGTFEAGYVSMPSFDITFMISFQFMPCIFVLMTRKTSILYESTFEKIGEMIGNENLMVVVGHERRRKVVHADFEQALMNAAEKYIGTVVGCWFHFCKALVAYFRQEGLATEIRQNRSMKRWLRRLVSLALLPHHMIDAVYLELKPENFLSDCSRMAKRKTKKVYEHLGSYWLGTVGSRRLSVYRQPYRTTNDIENYHGRLLKRIKVRHGNVWTFISEFC